jgi:RHS repeat-associated protein
VSKRFISDGGSDPAPGASSNWDHADDVTGDKVLEQAAYTYDNNGNVALVTSKQRFHDATDTGELGDPSSSSGTAKARVSYAAGYYDAIGRKTAEVSVGTNPVSGTPTAYTRPGSVPSRSDAVLVNSYTYNTAGRLSVATDPKGFEDRTEYDLLGRVTKTTEAYSDGTPSDADDRTTLYTYDGVDHVVTLTADMPSGTNDQVTQYVYGVTPTLNSDIYSNDLLAEVRYPDESAGTAGTSNSDKDRYAHNALGQVIKLTDRNQSTHEYTYDVAGRQLTDAATVLGSGVDGAIRRLETAYDTAGRPFKFTSYDAASSGSVVNQVQRAFNGLGQLTTEYQEHGGSVNTGTSLKVQHAYDTTASSSVYTKGSRPTSMTYPNGRVLRYEYSSGLDDSIGRVSYLADDSSGSVGTHLEEYSYLGFGTIAERKHPEPGVDLTYVTSGSTADAGDQYTGLDRFGRVTDQKWVKTSGGTYTDRFEYTYDRNSNRLSRDVTASSGPTDQDEAYTYDNLDRLSKMNRGTLSSGTISDGSATYTQRWDGAGGSGGLDALGNWKGVSTDADGGGGGSATTQSRTHDSRNQLTGVGGSTLTFDANGNMTTDETGKQLVYDGWNRLVQAKTNGGTNLVTYEYDALTRRVTTTPQGGTAREDYHSAAWQVTEEREGSTVKNQYVWSLAYVDAMVLRDRDAAAGGNLGKSGSGLEERLYAQQDANHNTTALVDTSGAVIERYRYLPYGTPTVLDANWAVDGDGASDVGWTHLHQGGRLDSTTGTFHFRTREYSASLGRWVQQDFVGRYVDGWNLYEYVSGNPQAYVDPLGAAKGDQHYGLPDEFWHWYHKQIKDKGDPDIGKDEAMAYHEEWESLGKPKPDSTGKPSGKKGGAGGTAGAAGAGALDGAKAPPKTPGSKPSGKAPSSKPVNPTKPAGGTGTSGFAGPLAGLTAGMILDGYLTALNNLANSAECKSWFRQAYRSLSKGTNCESITDGPGLKRCQDYIHANSGALMGAATALSVTKALEDYSWQLRSACYCQQASKKQKGGK